jgi:putative ABC transport system permease protein
MVGRRARLWLAWSLRDLRARRLQVAAIALIIALGSGSYAALGSTATWRRTSYRATFDALGMFDLHLSLATGGYVSRGALLAVARSIPHAHQIAAVEERLVGPTQVDASVSRRTILVPGRLVGLDLTAGGPRLTRVDATAGRTLAEGDRGRAVAVLDAHFARYHRLPARGRIRLSGGGLAYVGQGLGPEYLVIVGEQGNLLAEANFAVVFVSLETAQRLLGRPGLVDDLVLTLRPGANAAAIRSELAQGMRKRLPDAGFELHGRSGDWSYRLLYRDIDGDQRFYTIFALLILAGAAFASFNLAARMVEAQRREIGIGMALGAPPGLLAIRPLLVGLEIALLGVVFGVGVGLLVGWLVGGLFRTYQPLPVWDTPFQPLMFLRSGALGLVLPFLASAYPVWRALRVPPADAIRTGPLTAKTGGFAPLLARLPLPGRILVRIPVRNVVRTPMRSLLTLLGIAATIAILIGTVGVVDSFLETIDRASREVSGRYPDRLVVGTSFDLVSGPRIRAILDSPVVARASPGLEVGASIAHGGRKIDVVLDLLDFENGLWRPTAVAGRLPPAARGVVISRRAAEDLRVGPGDLVVLRHPRRVGLASYRLVSSTIPVAAIDPLPSRFTAFMDLGEASLMRLEGIANRVSVQPKSGVGTEQAERALFRLPGINSVQPVSAYTDSVRQALNQRIQILYVVEGAILLLALLIAFNSTSISVDERAREHATMFAFGLPVRAVLAMSIAESVLLGLAGTLVGIAVGRLLLGWLVGSVVASVVPEIGVVTYLAQRTLLTALVLGVAAVAVAPLLVLRKLRHMDVASALRVVE